MFAVSPRPGRSELLEKVLAMTLIKATCPNCGGVELTPHDVSLMVCSHAPLSYYAFTCLGCASEVRKPADDHVVSLLVAGGVPATVWEVPAEALETHEGATLTYDDLLDFALELGLSDTLTVTIAEETTRAAA